MLVQLFRGFTFLACFACLAAGAASAQTPPSVSEVIGPLEKKYGPFEERGYLPGVNAYFGRSCLRQSNSNLLLVRMTDTGPQVWAYTLGCPKTIGASDLDKDGSYEIVFTAGYAGPGFGKTSETHLGWPEGAKEPEELLSYFVREEADGDFLYGRLGFEPKEREYIGLYGKAHIPDDTTCKTVATCPVVKDEYFCFGSCDKPVPRHIAKDPGFKEFVAKVGRDFGARLANEGEPPSISTFRLQPLSELDSGQGPEWSAERQQQFDAWLQGN